MNATLLAVARKRSVMRRSWELIAGQWNGSAAQVVVGTSLQEMGDDHLLLSAPNGSWRGRRTCGCL